MDKMKKGVYAFIDSQNLNLGVQNAGWKMDWLKFRKFLADEYGVTKAYMFIGYVPEFEEMYEKLHETGYVVVLKQTYDMTRPRPEEKEITGSEETEKEEKKPVKGNIDADLVLHAMIEYPNYDKAIIVSGDGDFLGLVEYLEQQGKLLKLLTPSWKYSSLYKSFESYIDRVDKHRGQLSYRSYRKAKPK